MPTHLDLFSGIGGFALAAERTGWTTIGFSEIDDYATRVLAKHWPHVRNYGDIRNVPRGISADLLTAGPPCQPASVAGKQRGAADDRWLWPATLECVERVQPTVCLFENPCGLLALNGGVEFERVLSRLESLGYAVQPFIVPAVAVDARHRRDRVWIVAHADGEGLEGWQEQSAPQEREAIKRGDLPVSDTGHRRPRAESECWRPSIPFGGCRWIEEAQSGVCRVADGIPNRSHRLRGLGNSIVPQVAEMFLARMIKLF